MSRRAPASVLVSSSFQGLDENRSEASPLRAATSLPKLFLSLYLTGIAELHSREFSSTAGRREVRVAILESNSKILSQMLYFHIRRYGSPNMCQRNSCIRPYGDKHVRTSFTALLWDPGSQRQHTCLLWGERIGDHDRSLWWPTMQRMKQGTQFLERMLTENAKQKL